MTRDEIDQAITTVQEQIDTQPTLDTCKCMWRVHPDDIDKTDHNRRMVRIDEHPECPIHTQRGFVLSVLELLLVEVSQESKHD